MKLFLLGVLFDRILEFNSKKTEENSEYHDRLQDMIFSVF